jgi:hypothetical protein
MRFVHAVLPGLMLCAAIGCGGGSVHQDAEKKPTVSVSGIVTYQGKPLKDATVAFHSLDGGLGGNGKSDAVGSFRVTTYGNDDGLAPGKYKVTVAVSTVEEIEPGVLAPEPPGGFKSPIPLKFSNPQTTDVLVEIKDGEKNDLKIDLK